METLGNYLIDVFLEGLLLGGLFWVITYITVESSSLISALIAGFVAEAVGNLPYFWDLPATSPPGLLMSIIGAVVFVKVILRAGELTFGKAFYGTSMTYFVLVALVTCSA